MKIDTATVETLAKLARLNLADSQAAQFSHQLPSILEYVGKLNEIVVEAPPAVRDAKLNLRPDIVADARRADTIVHLAPDRLDRFWKVPAVL